MYKPKSASYSLSMRILTILTPNYYIREIILGEGDRSDMKNICTYIVGQSLQIHGYGYIDRYIDRSMHIDIDDFYIDI